MAGENRSGLLEAGGVSGGRVGCSRWGVGARGTGKIEDEAPRKRKRESLGAPVLFRSFVQYKVEVLRFRVNTIMYNLPLRILSHSKHSPLSQLPLYLSLSFLVLFGV